MKSLKIFFLAALVAVAGVFTACTEDGNWNAGPNEKGTRVYFSSENAATLDATADATSVAVTVARNETVGDLEVSVSAAFGSNDYASFFTVPQTVIFKDGMETATLTIGYDFSKLVGGESYDITLTVVDETLHSNYGYAEQTITVVCPEPYVLLGKGLYRDDMVFSLWTGTPSDFYQVEIYENTNYPGYIFVKNAYTTSWPAAAFNEAMGQTVPMAMAEGDTYFVIDARNPNKVILPIQQLGLDIAGYGDMLVAMISDAGVGTIDDCAGTFKDGVITFPSRGLYIQDSESGYYSNTNGAFMLLMPGVELTDYAMTVAYGGMQVAPDNTTVSAVLNGTYGADVASMRYAFFEGDVAGAAAQAAEIIIAAAEEEVNVMEFEQGLEADDRVFSLLESKLAAPGSYTVFCVPYNAAGEPVAAETAAASFYFPGMGGAEIPECEVMAMLVPFSWLYPDYVAQYPDSSTLGAVAVGVDIAACKYSFITGLGLEADLAGQDATDVVDYVCSVLGKTKDQIFYAFSADDIAEINSEYGMAFYFDGLPAETPCTLFVEATNSYGKSQMLATSCATTAEGVQAEPMEQKNAAKAGRYVLKTRKAMGRNMQVISLKK